MATKQRCPICGQEYTGAPALSREDNQTLICPESTTMRHARRRRRNRDEWVG